MFEQQIIRHKMRRPGSPISPYDEILELIDIWFEDFQYIRIVCFTRNNIKNSLEESKHSILDKEVFQTIAACSIFSLGVIDSL